MRDYKGMKRQRGRNRNTSGGGGQGGGGKPGQNANRAFDSQGPENIRVRGGAQHVYEKYNQLARDATTSGDRVLAENHLQHAEHYFRTLRVLQPNRSVTEIIGRDTTVNGFDLDFEDETLESAMAAADAAAAAQPQGPAQSPSGEGEAPGDLQRQGERFDRSERQGQGQGQGQGQDSQRREFRDRNDRQGGGYDRQDRNERSRYEGNRGRWEDRGERQGAQDNQAQNSTGSGGQERQERNERSRYEGRRDRWETRDQPPAGETVDAAAMVAPDSAAPSRTTFEQAPVADSVPVLRSEDGGVSEAPAFLSAGPAQSEEEGRRPRTRRPRRRADTEEPPRTEGADEGA